ncbi:MAG: hypothetical protein CL694_02605 [Chloroflexi bacterium]|nr:hypothetical protein [Chloroflexota bacterium]
MTTPIWKKPLTSSSETLHSHSTTRPTSRGRTRTCFWCSAQVLIDAGSGRVESVRLKGGCMDRVRLAIVGCGTISQLNGPGYVSHPKCDVVALCDPIRDRAVRRAREWAISPAIYTDLADVLADDTIDAVELLTPTYLHAEQAIASLEAGKHVSCQKPISVTVAEADAVIRAAESSSKTFRVTENFLYYPPIVKARELIASGAIGDPSLVRVRTVWAGQHSNPGFTIEPDALDWRQDPQLNAGGLLWDDGWHKVATAMWWIGDVESVSALISRTDDYMVEAPSIAMWKYADRDCTAVFEFASAPEMPIRSKYYPSDEFFEIVGREGVLWVTRCTGEMLDMPAVVFHRGDSSTSYQLPADWSVSFDGAANDFVDSLLAGRQPDMDARFGKRVLQATLAMYAASEAREWVSPNSMT